MKIYATLRPYLLALFLGLLTVPAWAGDDCDVPIERWQSRDAVKQMAAKKGWEVQRLKIDDGCYEIYGKDAEGRLFKAKINPETLEIVKFKFKKDKERERGAHAASDTDKPFSGE